jgi:hypothetical protein
MLGEESGVGREKNRPVSQGGLAYPCLEGFRMNPIICDSIRDRRRMRFTYNGRTRLVEPQCYGIGSRGTELLRVHQIQGGSQREPLFDVSKMSDLVALADHFEKPGPNYKKNDSAMTRIFCQL